MIEEKFIDLFASNAKVPVGIARQEIVLTYALALMEERKVLGRLAFKGGTCLRKVIFGKNYRFSEDLDFTILGITEPEGLLALLQETFADPFCGIAFKQSKGSGRITDGGVGVQFEYEASAATGAFDIEVSFRAEPILPVVRKILEPQSYFRQLEVKPPDVSALAYPEIVSEKIRATFQRTRPRDVYDLYYCLQKPLSVPQLKALVLIKCWQVRDPFDIERFVTNLHSTKYDWDELENFLPKSSWPKPEKMINLIESKMKCFSKLTEREEAIVADSKRHKSRALIESAIVEVRKLSR